MKPFVFLMILMLPLTGSAQLEGKPVDSLDTLLPELAHPNFYNLRYLLGVFPEVQFIKSPVIGVSASYARLLDVEWAAFGRGVNLGFEFDPIQKFYGPKFTLWSAGFALVVGGNVSMSTMYYFQEGRSALYLRPEVGIGIPCIHLKYGFGFRAAGNELSGIQRHSLTLGCHIPLKKFDKVPR